MKRFILSMIPCLALGLMIGCGGSGTTQVIETEVSAEDQAAADDAAQQYGSAAYAEAMANQNKRE